TTIINTLHVTFCLVIFRCALRDLERVRRRVEDGRVPAAGCFLTIAAVTIERHNRFRGNFVTNRATDASTGNWFHGVVWFRENVFSAATSSFHPNPGRDDRASLLGNRC